MFRAYDEAVAKFVTRKMGDEFVPLVGPISPLRAFGAFNEILKNNKVPDAIKNDRFVPLPFMSFDRLDPIYDQSRFSRADVRKLAYSPDGNKSATGRRPNPFNIPYQVEIWAEKESDGLFLWEAMLRRWRGPKASIVVNHGTPWGDWKVWMDVPRMRDTSVKESEKKDREIRYTVDLVVEGFLSFPVDWVPTVRRVSVHEQQAPHPNTEPTVVDDMIVSYDGVILET